MPIRLTKKRHVRQLVFVVPLLGLFLFLQLVWTHRYAASAEFVLRNNKVSRIQSDSHQSNSQQDLGLIREYLLSPGLYEILDNEIGLGKSYCSRNVFALQRLPADSSLQRQLEQYRKLTHVYVDHESGIITLEAENHDAVLAQKQVDLSLKQAEIYINQLSREIARKQTVDARAHVTESRAKLDEARDQLLTFQQTNTVALPDQEGAQTFSVITRLETELALAQSELSGTRAFLNESAPEIASLKARIEALQNQIATERTRLVGGDKDTPSLNEVLARYQFLKLELDFATEGYSQALLALQRAQIASAENLKALVTISSPVLPGRTLYPRVWLWMIPAVIFHSFIYRPISSWLLKLIRRNDPKQPKCLPLPTPEENAG